MTFGILRYETTSRFSVHLDLKYVWLPLQTQAKLYTAFREAREHVVLHVPPKTNRTNLRIFSKNWMTDNGFLAF